MTRLQQTQKAVKSARAARAKRWICFFIILAILIVIAVVVAVEVIKNQVRLPPACLSGRAASLTLYRVPLHEQEQELGQRSPRDSLKPRILNTYPPAPLPAPPQQPPRSFSPPHKV